MNDNYLSGEIIKYAMKVHTALGPGFLESVYQSCLFYELTKAGFQVKKEEPLPLIYEEMRLECAYRIDLFVENQIIVEIKSLENIMPVHQKQLLTYLRLSKRKIGLLINFNVEHLKDGIKRVINSQ